MIMVDILGKCAFSWWISWAYVHYIWNCRVIVQLSMRLLKLKKEDVVRLVAFVSAKLRGRALAVIKS
jgi:hypothetical protein